ncbi:multidrug efflux SMR transporter [Tateyamaria omphalii]|uniref:DMT family transporter n=1 Tax=Tateyamaria omphalii TaxID=299262 RepID=UPI001C997B8E|nr:multidrug efflux SMR transporter [Tateyamaria omphalii]MBY5931697.1 multidrug efflux SMR transporter [Tateyamaria omphalii]
MHWVYLGIAIVAEVCGSAALKASDGFTRFGPSALAIIGFGLALYFLSLSLRTLPLGVAYAIWAGVGTALIATISVLVFRQCIDPAGVLGIALIVSGVIVINLVSNVAQH